MLRSLLDLLLDLLADPASWFDRPVDYFFAPRPILGGKQYFGDGLPDSDGEFTCPGYSDQNDAYWNSEYF